MKIRFDMNAKTAMVYGGAAFLLVIIGFRSIIATLDPDHIGVMTYLSIGGTGPRVLPFNFIRTKYLQSWTRRRWRKSCQSCQRWQYGW